MAARLKHDLLIDILDPSRDVEGNFRVYKIVTVDGQVFSGLLASETKTSVELLDSVPNQGHTDTLRLVFRPDRQRAQHLNFHQSQRRVEQAAAEHDMPNDLAVDLGED